MPNHIQNPQLQHRYHHIDNTSNDIDQWEQHHHHHLHQVSMSTATASSTATKDEMSITNIPTDGAGRSSKTPNVNHLLMNEKFHSMSVVDMMHHTPSTSASPHPPHHHPITTSTRSSLGQLIERSTSAPPPILLQHPFTASTITGGSGNHLYHHPTCSPSLRNSANNNNSTNTNNSTGSNTNHSNSHPPTHPMTIPTTIITTEDTVVDDPDHHDDDDTGVMNTSHQLFDNDIYEYVTKGYSDNNNNGPLSKTHNLNHNSNYNMVDDDSGRATSQTTNSSNNNNGNQNHHHLFPPTSSSTTSASPIGTGRSQSASTATIAISSHNTIGHAVTRPLSTASVTGTNTGSTSGFTSSDQSGSTLLFVQPPQHTSNHHSDAFLNHDYAIKIQRSQSAAPSMNSNNDSRSSLTKMNTIGVPPGLSIPQQEHNSSSESFVSFPSPFSSSSCPFGSSNTATTASTVGGGIRRPASAGVVGGSSLYHHSTSQSGGAVRPAPKTLMELIQEESIPQQQQHNIPLPLTATAGTGTTNVVHATNTPQSLTSSTPSPPQTQSILPSLSSNNRIATTIPKTNTDQASMYSPPNTFESHQERQFLPAMSGGDILMTRTSIPLQSLPPQQSSSSSLQRQVRHDQERQQYEYHSSSNNIITPLNNIDYFVEVNNSGITNDMPNEIHRYNSHTAKVQYTPQQQQQHAVHVSDTDPQQQPYSTYNPNIITSNLVNQQYQLPVNSIKNNNIYRQSASEFVVDEGLEQQQIMMQAPIYIPQQQQLLQNGQHIYFNNVQQQQQQTLVQHQSNNRMQQQQQPQQRHHVNNVPMNNGQHQPQTIYADASGQLQQQQQGYGYTTVQYQSPHHLQQQQQQQAQMLQHHTPMSSGTNQAQDQYVSVVPIQRGSSNTSVSYWQPNGMMQQQHSHHQQQQVLFPTSGLVTMGGQISNTMDTMYHVPVANSMKGRDSKVSRGRRGTVGRGGGGRDTKPDVPTTSAILDEFHSAKSRDWTIRRIEGHVVEFCQDQSGSRFIQQRLEMGDHTEQQIVMKEVLRAIRRLRNDVFGNYVVQKLLDFGTAKMKSEIRDTLEGEMLSLSLQMYGCRVVQKAIETVDEEDLPRLLREFHNDVLGCIHDQNGNHVIQKCIEVLNSRANKADSLRDLHRATFLREQIDFILNDILTNAIALSCHPYGCRVLQRILEHCTEEKKVAILNEIKLCHKDLLDDQYGNYVIQHVLQYGRDDDRDSIVQIVVDCGLLGLARQKFASNVVEKLLKYGNNDQRRAVVREMLKKADDPSVPSEPGDGNTVVVLLMVRDAYANYVVQTTLDVVPESDEKHLLLKELNSHTDELRNYTFAKHIVAKLTSLAAATSP